MPSGSGGQVALNKAGSLYHVVASASVWTNFVSENISHTIEQLREGAITGRRDAPPSHKGLDHGEGDLVLEPNPNAIGHFLQGAFGTRNSSLVIDAGSTGANSGEGAGKPVFYHRFTPRISAYDQYVFLEPYNVMVYKDVGSAFMLNGAIFHGIQFDIQAGQLVKTTVNVMGREMRRIQRTTAIFSLVSSGGRPFTWDMASVSVSTTGIGSAALFAKGQFESLSITLRTPHEGVPLLDGTKFYGEMQPNDFRMVELSGTLSFRDQSEYDAFTAYESRRLHVTMMNQNTLLQLGNPASADVFGLGHYGLRLIMPEVKFTKWDTPIQGPNRLQTQFSAVAEYNDAAGAMIIADLTNVVSGATYALTA